MANYLEPEHRVPTERLKPHHMWVWAVAGIVAILAATAVAILLTLASPDQTAFSQFWKPMLGEGDRVLVAVAHPLVYHPSVRAARMNAQRLPPEAVPVQRAIQLPPGDLNGSDMVPIFDQYVGFGDLVMSADLVAFLARQGKTARVRLASKVEFADFKDAPTILIGAFTNRWTLELSQTLPFRFILDADGMECVQDSADPKRRWRLSSPSAADVAPPEDFVVVTRLVSSSAGKPMLMVGGIKQFGTEAGGRLLVNPREIGPLLRKLPADWGRRNVQLVLRASVIGNSPAAAEIVAWRVW